MMERQSRSDLLITVASQKEKLEKYESKLKDLIHAYKGVIKEKEALEATVSVLNSSHGPVDTNSGNDGDCQEEGGTNETSESVGHSEKIKVLMASVAALTQEKTRLEAMYVAEKKQIKQEKYDLEMTLTNEREARNLEISELTSQIQDFKNKIRAQQREREKEQTDHVLMLRELQDVLAEERTLRDKVELELAEVQFSLKEAENELSVYHGYQEKVNLLNKEVLQLNEALKVSEEKAEIAAEPLPLVVELQKQLVDMEIKYHNHLLAHEKQLAQAEQRLKICKEENEASVSDFEVKISELSTVIGDYERVKCQNENVTLKLKERISNLESESSALTQAMLSKTITGSLNKEQCVEQITMLLEHLKQINITGEMPIPLRELLDLEESDCTKCQGYLDELSHLREEFECYKLRAQSVLKSRNTKETTSSKELETLKSQVLEYKEKLRDAYSNTQEVEAMYEKKLDDQRLNLLSIQDAHKQETLKAASDYKQQIADIELELRKQRARTVTLLAEKDRNIDHLRQLTPVSRLNTEAWLERNAGASEEVLHPDLIRTRSQEEQTVINLIGQSVFPGQNESMLYVHFSEEQARKDIELTALRKQKRQLQNDMRLVEQSAEAKEEKLTEKIELLEEEVRKQQRDKSRENANLEYLKNVTFKFLTSTDAEAKLRMVNAIATILQFSPAEKDVATSTKNTWW